MQSVYSANLYLFGTPLLCILKYLLKLYTFFVFLTLWGLLFGEFIVILHHIL